MRTIFSFFIGIILSISILNAQEAPPQAFSYKASIKYSNGLPVIYKVISIRLSILQTSTSGISIYSETFKPTTNLVGQVDLEVGRGTVLSGSFSNIDWSYDEYFLKIEVDVRGGTNYIELSTTQLLSVPYALYAGSAGNVFSGLYSDLIDAPVLSLVATSGNYYDLFDLPTLFSGDYNDLTNIPDVFSGNYEDLLNKPILFDGTWNALTGKPAFTNVAFSGSYTDLLDKPTLFSGDYNDLANKPTLFSGNYNDLINKPTSLSQFNNDAGFIAEETDPVFSTHPAFGLTTGNIGDWNTAFGWGNHTGLYRPISYVPDWIEITNRPAFATVATSGSYNDLIGKPAGNNKGDLLYWSGKDWKVVPVGTNGQVLTLINGIPTWMGLPSQAVVITTNEINTYYSTKAEFGGNITSDGGSEITSRGICWSQLSNPTTEDDNNSNGSGCGAFSSWLTGLYPGTTYYVRSYAINSSGTTYGNQLSFTALAEETSPIVFDPYTTYGSVTDINGNTYKTVQIGTQVWMAENLRVTKYSDGTPIPSDPISCDISYDWPNYDYGAYCEYITSLCKTQVTTYGRLYNYYTIVDSRNLCPSGWHVPTGAEFEQLITYLGGILTAGYKMKEEGTTHWFEGGGGNTSGFTALPGGIAWYNGTFGSINYKGFWWFIYDPENTTTAKGISLSTEDWEDLITIESFDENCGLSVRCLKD